MDPADLRVFAAVARLGSMRAAAEDLNTVQSNVTARVRSLEEEIGVPLFERHSRGVTLTTAGQRLLPYVAEVSRVLRDAAAAARDDGQPKGPLLLGSLETTLALRVSPLLSAYAHAFPDVDLTIRTGTTCELIERVLNHEMDGAFVCGPVDHPELIQETVFREELAIMTAPDVNTLDAALAVRGLKIIVLRIGCSYRQRLEEILARRGIVGLRTLEFGTIEAIVGSVAAGLGITLLPRGLIGPVWQAGRVRLHRLAPEDAIVETVFIRPRARRVSSALAAFLARAGTADAGILAAE